MGKKRKIKIYEKVISYIIEKPYQENFICTLLQNKENDFNKSLDRGSSNNNSKLIRKNFKELLLFKEGVYDENWLNTQLGFLKSYSINKYRIFIIQMCIEMIK